MNEEKEWYSNTVNSREHLVSPESHFLYAQRGTITVKVAYYLHNVQQEESKSCTLEGKWPSYNINLKLPYTLLYFKLFDQSNVLSKKKFSFPVEFAWHFPYHCGDSAEKERVHTSIKKELTLKKATSLFLRCSSRMPFSRDKMKLFSWE